MAGQRRLVAHGESTWQSLSEQFEGTGVSFTAQ